MNRVFLGLGSNLGDGETNIKQCLSLMEEFAEVVQVSSFYETPPWGYESANPFVNACAEILTTQNPQDLLSRVKTVEKDMGREQSIDGYQDRVIDVDILLFNDLILNEDHLQIPHPGMAYRKFVLAPLNDIAKNVRHPQLKKTINELLILSLDTSEIKRIGEG